MTSKLNANAPIFIPLSNTQNPQQTWTQIQCLEEFITSLNPKLQENKQAIQTLQTELKSYFILSFSYNNPVLNQLNDRKKCHESLQTMYDTLNNELAKMKAQFILHHPTYIHKPINPQILINESTKTPTQKHKLIIFGYVRNNNSVDIPVDVIHLLQSFVTPFVEAEFIWKLKGDVFQKYKASYPIMSLLSDTFYCDNIGFMLSLGQFGFHLNFNLTNSVNISRVIVSYRLYHIYTATLFQNTEGFVFKDSVQLSGCKVMGKRIRDASQITLGCNVRILSILYNDGRVKHNEVKMRSNFIYHWMMNEVLSLEIVDCFKGKKWHSNSFDNNNWCLSVYKSDKWRFRFGLKLLQLPHNVGKIAIKYGINQYEYRIEEFSYQQPLRSWSMAFINPPIDQFALIISIQIMAVFDIKGKYVSDWKRFGII